MSGAAVAEPKAPRYAVWLTSLASASALSYAALLWLSWKFTDGATDDPRPTIWMLALFGGLFVLYWLALWIAVRLQPSRLLIVGIFAAACLFRAIMLPSILMHEIDIYRYIWDGAVLANGISPYRYAPQQVRDAVDSGVDGVDETLERLVELQSSSDSLGDSLYQIHYASYPSPYPPVSQAVFVLSAKLTPDSASLHMRVIIMKALLVLMDLATLVVVMLLVRDVGMHVGWSLAYGWCPLLMKEIANAGHLDSIAIFLTTLAIWMLVKTVQAATSRWTRHALTGVVVALAIGAKLYPIVLLPLFAALWLRRCGWASAVVGLGSTALVSAVLLYPLFGPSAGTPPIQVPQPAESPSGIAGQLNVPPPSTQEALDADEGVRAFLAHWEMNDLLFMLVLENLRPQADVVPEKRPWFALTPDDWSREVVTSWAALIDKFAAEPAIGPAEELSPEQFKTASFSLARFLTGGAFALLACCLAWLAAGKNDARAWCRAGLLTLAWFWLTCPTQNPWYWCWALPLLPFVRYRTWYVVSAATMLYYLRFWLSANYPDSPVLGTPYNGAYFFYFVIAWIEFVPVLLALTMEWLWRRRRTPGRDK